MDRKIDKYKNFLNEDLCDKMGLQPGEFMEIFRTKFNSHKFSWEKNIKRWYIESVKETKTEHIIDIGLLTGREISSKYNFGQTFLFTFIINWEEGIIRFFRGNNSSDIIFTQDLEFKGEDIIFLVIDDMLNMLEHEYKPCRLEYFSFMRTLTSHLKIYFKYIRWRETIYGFTLEVGDYSGDGYYDWNTRKHIKSEVHQEGKRYSLLLDLNQLEVFTMGKFQFNIGEYSPKKDPEDFQEFERRIFDGLKNLY